MFLLSVDPIDEHESPWQRVLRTVVQVAIPAVVGLVLVLPEVIDVVLDAYGTAVPDELRAWLLGLAGLIVVTSGAIARVMAIPGVNEWLSRWTPFGTVPRGKYAKR